MQYFNIHRPTFIQIIKKKAVEQFSPIPYLATVLNCMFWVFYGLPIVHPNSLLVITINGIGLALEAIYLTIFFVYATRDGRVSIYNMRCHLINFSFTHNLATKLNILLLNRRNLSVEGDQDIVCRDRLRRSGGNGNSPGYAYP